MCPVNHTDTAARYHKVSGLHFNPNRTLDFMVDFALLSGRLISAFIEDVAGYIEKKQEARCRQQYGRQRKSQQKHTVNSHTLFGGLMTVLGLIRRKE